MLSVKAFAINGAAMGEAALGGGPYGCFLAAIWLYGFIESCLPTIRTSQRERNRQAY
jgi:hypothetical protein